MITGPEVVWGSWRCLIFGHKVDDMAAYYGDCTCTRCGRWDTEPVFLVQRGLLNWAVWHGWQFRLWLRGIWYDTAMCGECKQRVDCGPDRCDCLPF